MHKNSWSWIRNDGLDVSGLDKLGGPRCRWQAPKEVEGLDYRLDRGVLKE